jgi:hypothetical protein
MNHFTNLQRIERLKMEINGIVRQEEKVAYMIENKNRKIYSISAF